MSSLCKAFGKMIGIIRKAERSEASEEASSPSASLPSKVYLKALPLRSLEDVDEIKREVKSGNILILKVTPLAKKSLDDVKRAVVELHEFTQQIGGDIARLGEERVVITPPSIRIWREKIAASKEGLPQFNCF